MYLQGFSNPSKGFTNVWKMQHCSTASDVSIAYHLLQTCGGPSQSGWELGRLVTTSTGIIIKVCTTSQFMRKHAVQMYEMGEQIGSGTFGTVWRAKHTQRWPQLLQFPFFVRDDPLGSKDRSTSCR